MCFANTLFRSCLHFSSSLDLRSFTTATVSSTTLCKAPKWKSVGIVPRAGNGGFRLCGNSSGLGYTRLTCSGRVAVSVTFTVGGLKLSAAALLGKVSTLLLHDLMLTVVDSQHLRFGLHPCILRSLPPSTLSCHLRRGSLFSSSLWRYLPSGSLSSM
jgi:hypothetical protein